MCIILRPTIYRAGSLSMRGMYPAQVNYCYLCNDHIILLITPSLMATMYDTYYINVCVTFSQCDYGCHIYNMTLLIGSHSLYINKCDTKKCVYFITLMGCHTDKIRPCTGYTLCTVDNTTNRDYVCMICHIVVTSYPHNEVSGINIYTAGEKLSSLRLNPYVIIQVY